MSEIVCLICNAPSPENALYCQQCGQPLRCQNCQNVLLPNARACIQCGKTIPERSSNDQFYLGASTVPPGYNRLKLHETPDVRDVDLTVSNEAIANIGDYLPSLIGNRPKGRHDSSMDHQPPKQPDLVEVTSEIPTPQPQLPAAVSRPVSAENSPDQGIWQIFRNNEGRLTQERLDLKAASKRDYIIRLAFLYIYARWLLNEEKVPRDDVFKILDEAGVKDTNRSKYIAASGIRSDENETLRLSLEGRNRAQQYIVEVLDAHGAEGWLPNQQARPTSSRVKKSNKKSSEQHISVDADVTKWVSHEETKVLVSAIPHSIVDNLSTFNKALLALYGIYKADTEQEVPVASIVKYLYKAFKVQVKAQTVSKKFYDERKEKTSKASFVTFVEGQGYQITPSGREHIENLLNLKQPQLATTEGNVRSNGAV